MKDARLRNLDEMVGKTVRSSSVTEAEYPYLAKTLRLEFSDDSFIELVADDAGHFNSGTGIRSNAISLDVIKQ